MKSISEREAEFRKAVSSMPFPDIIEEFADYWSEPNKSGTKLRFELEKTWDLSRRMKRWQAIKDSRPDFGKGQVAKVEKVMTKIPVNDTERLDAFFTCYSLRPTKIDFESFEQYFEFMKAERLLKELNEEEKETLRECYGNNGKSLRCAWVQKTLDSYANTGLKPSDILRMRNQMK